MADFDDDPVVGLDPVRVEPFGAERGEFEAPGRSEGGVGMTSTMPGVGPAGLNDVSSVPSTPNLAMAKRPLP